MSSLEAYVERDIRDSISAENFPSEIKNYVSLKLRRFLCTLTFHGLGKFWAEVDQSLGHWSDIYCRSCGRKGLNARGTIIPKAGYYTEETRRVWNGHYDLMKNLD